MAPKDALVSATSTSRDVDTAGCTTILDKLLPLAPTPFSGQNTPFKQLYVAKAATAKSKHPTVSVAGQLVSTVGQSPTAATVAGKPMSQQEINSGFMANIASYIDAKGKVRAGQQTISAPRNLCLLN